MGREWEKRGSYGGRGERSLRRGRKGQRIGILKGEEERDGGKGMETWRDKGNGDSGGDKGEGEEKTEMRKGSEERKTWRKGIEIRKEKGEPGGERWSRSR